jgi:hypothetical protein
VVLAAGAIVAAAAPIGAGATFTVSVTGVATCNTTTGNYDITWTITKTNQPSSPTKITSAVQAPGSTLTVNPNPIPAAPAPNFATAASSLPGSTVGAVTLTVLIAATPTVGSLDLTGTCVVVPVTTPAVPSQPTLTG